MMGLAAAARDDRQAAHHSRVRSSRRRSRSPDPCCRVRGVARGRSRRREGRKQLRELRGRIAALQKRLVRRRGIKNRGRRRAAGLRARDLRRQPRAARTRRRSSASWTQRLASVRAESGACRSATLEVQQALLARAALPALTSAPSPAPLKLLLNREDPNQIARRSRITSPHLSRARAAVISDLRGNLERLEASSRARRQKQSARELAAIVAEQQAQRKRLEREKSARSKTAGQGFARDHSSGAGDRTLKRDEDRLARQAGRALSRAGRARERPGPAVAQRARCPSGRPGRRRRSPLCKGPANSCRCAGNSATASAARAR